MKHLDRRAFLGATACSSLTFAAKAQGQTLKFVVPIPAGTTADIVARAIKDPLEKALRLTIVVEDKPGAGGSIAAKYVANGDASTFLFATSSAMFAGVMSVKNVADDFILSNFAPVSLLGRYAFVLVVNDQVPSRTLKEFIEYAKKHQLAFGRGAPFAYPLTAEFNKLVGITALDLPAGTGGERSTIQDLLSNRIQYYIATTFLAEPHIRSGKLKALAIATGNRSVILPEVPTMAEAGLPEFVPLESCSALFGSKNLPASEAARIAGALKEVIARDDLKELFKKMDFWPATSTPEELTSYTAKQLAAWRAVQKKTGIEPQ